MHGVNERMSFPFAQSTFQASYFDLSNTARNLDPKHRVPNIFNQLYCSVVYEILFAMRGSKGQVSNEFPASWRQTTHALH